jgi:hypothetical protein
MLVFDRPRNVINSGWIAADPSKKEYQPPNDLVGEGSSRIRDALNIMFIYLS